MNFEEVYTAYKDLVYNLALHYLQHVEDAEEVTQDTFVAVHQALASFREEAHLKTWIYRIAINKSLDRIKTRKRQKRFAFFTSLFHEDGRELYLTNTSIEHPGIILEQKEALERLFRWINDLPDKQKTALILSKLEHKSQKEIAAIMNLSPKAVESLIQRAKSGLAKKMEQNEGN